MSDQPSTSPGADRPSTGVDPSRSRLGGARRAWTRSDGSLRVGRLLALAAAVVGVWVLACAVLVLSALGSADAGLERLRAARAELEAADLLDDAGDAAFAAAERDFRRAESRLSHPVLAPARVLPVVGRQLRTARALAGTAEDLSATGRAALEDVRGELEGGAATGADRVRAVEAVVDAARRLDGALGRADLGPSRALLPPVAAARADVADAVDEARDLVDDVLAVGGSAATLLRGPSRYLVLAAHNSEMRAGSGMFLSAAVLEVEDGSLALGQFRWTGDLTLPPGAVVVTGDLEDRWGWAEPGREWRNLAMSPRFDANAELAAEMWAALGGDGVDGVLALDPVALQGLLRVVGPVEVDGRPLDAEHLLEYVFLGQYQEAEAAGGDQDARRDALGRVANEVVAALEAGRWEVPDLLPELQHAVAGRHLLAWSRADVQQRGWERGGLAGTLGPGSLLVSVLNTGGTKLDAWLDVSADLGAVVDGPETEVTIRIELTNGAPPGLPRYVAGPTRAAAEGEYAGVLAVNVPGAARRARFEGVDDLVAAGPDGPTRVVATTVRVPRGEVRAFTLRYQVPTEVGPGTPEPSARVPPVRWLTGGG